MYTRTQLKMTMAVIAPVTVIVPPGNVANILVQLPIIDDAGVIAEEREQFFVGVLSFAGDSNGATLGRNATKLIITDDDGKICLTHPLSMNPSCTNYNNMLIGSVCDKSGQWQGSNL